MSNSNLLKISSVSRVVDFKSRDPGSNPLMGKLFFLYFSSFTKNYKSEPLLLHFQVIWRPKITTFWYKIAQIDNFFFKFLGFDLNFLKGPPIKYFKNVVSIIPHALKSDPQLNLSCALYFELGLFSEQLWFSF